MAIETTVRTHTLKTDPDVFDAVASGEKTFEIRWNDRGYQVGDVLFLRKTRYTGAQMIEGLPLEYIGDPIRATVTYVLQGPVYGLAHGWVIMGIAVAAPRPEAVRQADLPRCKLCQREPFVSQSGFASHPVGNTCCPMWGVRMTSAQWAILMIVPEPAIAYDSLTVKEAKEHLAKGITYAQRANENSGLYKPKLNPKMGEQQ